LSGEVIHFLTISCRRLFGNISQHKKIRRPEEYPQIAQITQIGRKQESRKGISQAANSVSTNQVILREVAGSREAMKTWILNFALLRAERQREKIGVI